MPIITISILGEKELEVDKMEDNDEDEGGSCPVATRDEDVNEQNKQQCVEEANYRDADTGAASKISEVCGNCGAFNQTSQIMKCLGGEEDKGYCQIYSLPVAHTTPATIGLKAGPITDSKFDLRNETM
jgi:hypothetical protein